MKKNKLLTIVLIGWNVSLLAQNDFFPLNIGNQWNYSYKSEESQFFDISFRYQLTTDSGSIKYNIIDSLNQDSVIIWTFQEQDIIERRTQNFYDSTDTAFSINANSTFQLTEYLDSNHTLKSQSYFEVFTFPVKWNYLISSTPITRFNEDSSIFIIQEYHYIIAIYRDSLVFNKNVGLVYAKSIIDKGPNTPYYYKWEASLDSYVTDSRNEETFNPKGFELYHNYPNPFNPTTTINFEIPVGSDVSIKIYNSLGEEIRTLIDEYKNPGSYTIRFDASNLASGIYFYQLKAKDFISTKKMVLLR